MPPPAVFEKFNAIKAIDDTVKVQSYASLLSANDAYNIKGFRYQIREGTYPNMPASNMSSFLEYHYIEMQKFAFDKNVLNLDIYVFTFAIQPIPVLLVKASNAAGGNRLGLEESAGDRIFMEYDVSWVNPLCDDQCPGFIEDIAEQLKAYQASTYSGVAPTHYTGGDVDFVS